MFVNSASISMVIILMSNVRSDIIYKVPEPKIEIFKNGFRFSIPHEEGIELFAFHGNVNERMRGIEAGHFSKDILKKCGNSWVFEEESTKLYVGDSIYFWLFVIKNNLGYRYDDGQYTVNEITNYTSLCCDEQLKKKKPHEIWIYENTQTNDQKQIAIYQIAEPTTKPSPRKENSTDEDKNIGENKEQLIACCELFLNTSYRLLALEKENQRLIEENEILYEIAQKDQYYAKTLRLFGKYPTKYYPTPKDFAQNLILEKLFLEDVQVIEAKAIPDNGISFKVEKLSDKVKIIIAARKGLEGSNYELVW